MLLRAGIKCDDPELLEFCGKQINEKLTINEAHNEILEWRVRMLSSNAYRDHKARLGSLVHHYGYSIALGLVDPDICKSKNETKNWLWHQCQNLFLFEKPSDQDWYPSEEAVDELCESAYAYVLSLDEWLKKAKPRWSTIGQEAFVARISSARGDEEFEGLLQKRFGMTIAQLDALPTTLQAHVEKIMRARWAGTVDGYLTLVKEDYGYPWPDEWPGEAISAWVDFKTTNAIQHKSVQAQVCAYANCDKLILMQAGVQVEEHDLPESDLTASLHIGPHISTTGLRDAFGVLSDKSAQIGCALYTYPKDPRVLEGFLGLVEWDEYCNNVPKAHQQRKRSTEPKATKIPKTAPRPAPFG